MKRVPAVLVLSLVLAACQSTAPSGSGLQAQIVATEIMVGKQQRFPIGILDQNTPVRDATVHVQAFLLTTDGIAGKGQSDAPFKGEGLGGAGVYVATLDFDVAGDWGVDITARRPNGTQSTIRLPFSVLAAPVVPGVGQPAPRSQNPTAKDVPDVSYIDSGRPPDDMHQISIAGAIAQHRPTLVVFASPAFCTSRICGPQVQVVQSLEPGYRSRLTFIHIEIYKDIQPDPSKRQCCAQTVLDWRLQSEPWIFLIDGSGIIRDRFEGPTGADEVKLAIDQLLAA